VKFNREGGEEISRKGAKGAKDFYNINREGAKDAKKSLAKARRS